MNAVELRNITKKFEGVVANKNVSLTVKMGTIHSIVGENGAGKTTLMRVLYGMLKPDSGEILVKERPVKITDPSVAIRLGIGMVHQHFMLVPNFTVAENVILGNEPVRGFSIDYERAKEVVYDLSQKYKLSVYPESKIEDLPVGIQQRVEILKLLYRGAEILILDEPTAILTPQETEELFGIISGMKKRGKTIILITHKLDEVMAVSDYVTVMRRGEVVGTVKKEEITKEELAYMMVGRKVDLMVRKEESVLGDVMLELVDVYAGSGRRQSALKGISFTVRSGEIYGIAGVEGNGQTELVEIITGLRKISSGDILFRGISIANRKPRELFKLGLAHIPEDRQRDGLILEFSLWENLILGIHYVRPYTVRGLLNTSYIKREAERLAFEYDIRPLKLDLQVKAFSGGNQQKVVLAREINKRPRLIVAAHPTRGVDIGGIEFIQRKLVDEAKSGAAVLLISADLAEIFALSDRISVLYDGRIVGTFRPNEIDEYQLGLLMLGGKGEKA